MPKSTLLSNLYVDELDFNDITPDILKTDDFYRDWPVVYILHNDKEIYIGETYHSEERMRQHLKNEERRRLNKCYVFASSYFTKSATLDIESSLIELCTSDNVLRLQNANPGIVKHNYANKENFAQDSKLFGAIWSKLLKLNLVKTDIETLKNTDLFKYSPYKSLNPEQCTCRDFIISDILESFEKEENKIIFVNGSAGTGKTILALYLLKLLVTGGDYINDDLESENYPFINDLKKIIKLKGGDLKVGYVVAMNSFRASLNAVIKEIAKNNPKFKKIKILSPNTITNEKYDVLIVDEAHRLKQAKSLGPEIGTFYKTNEKLGFTKKEANQLDWILKQSRIQILFYDESQSIRPSDIDKEYFDNLLLKSDRFLLSSQMRCLGGNDYIQYVKDILNCKTNIVRIDFKDKYDFVLYEDINDFSRDILNAEMKYGLSRIVAGYGFKWVSKGKKNSNIKDIVIEDKSFIWNRANTKWPLTIKGKDVIEEVGCIHTIQGYDLNYCGVIFGPEIYYDGKEIRVNKSLFFDETGKKGVQNEEDLLSYVKNIYAVLLTRGIKGTYVYVCDIALRNYLSKWINKDI